MKAYFLIFIMLASLLKPAAQSYEVGSTTVTFVDPDRNNRQIPTAIYYPAVQAGQNTPLAPGEFPVISFGHGFVMVHTAYQFLWLHLVSKGYILAFPTTEGSFSPNHLNFGLDLAFIITQMKIESQNENSLFYNAVAETSAIMGHSMGGGASFLGSENNDEPTTMVTFAAAITNPSSVQAAANVSIPTLLFAGEFDCVTPPGQHQYPMYEATASDRKIIIDISGGGHCFFADYNLFCSIGEASCSPQPSVSREEQQTTTLDFLTPYFDYMLKGNEAAWQVFLDSLQTSARIDYLMDWNTVSASIKKSEYELLVYPNPFRNEFTVEIPGPGQFDSLVVWNSKGQQVYAQSLKGQTLIQINTRPWQKGAYFIALVSEKDTVVRKVLKR